MVYKYYYLVNGSWTESKHYQAGIGDIKYTFKCIYTLNTGWVKEAYGLVVL